MDLDSVLPGLDFIRRAGPTRWLRALSMIRGEYAKVRSLSPFAGARRMVIVTFPRRSIKEQGPSSLIRRRVSLLQPGSCIESSR